jgi:hypothetical protein
MDVHGKTRSVAELKNDGYVVLMTKDWNVAEQYSGRSGAMYMIRPGDNSEVFDARKENTRREIGRKLIDDYREGSLSSELEQVIEAGLLEYQDNDTGQIVLETYQK